MHLTHHLLLHRLAVSSEFAGLTTFEHWPIRTAKWMGEFDPTSATYSSINEENIKHALKVIEQVVKRYAGHPAVLGLEPVNEPWQYTPIERLKRVRYRNAEQLVSSKKCILTSHLILIRSFSSLPLLSFTGMAISSSKSMLLTGSIFSMTRSGLIQRFGAGSWLGVRNEPSTRIFTKLGRIQTRVLAFILMPVVKRERLRTWNVNLDRLWWANGRWRLTIAPCG